MKKIFAILCAASLLTACQTNEEDYGASSPGVILDSGSSSSDVGVQTGPASEAATPGSSSNDADQIQSESDDASQSDSSSEQVPAEDPALEESQPQ